MSSTDLLAPGGVTHVPGVYDPASAALAVRAGIRAAYLSGEAIAATMLEPSTVSATQIADRAAVLGSFLSGVPLLADAQVGFEDPDAALWAALSYQRAGISGIVLGDGSPLRVTAVKERAPGILVIASAPGGTLDEIIAACRTLASAGADAVLPLGARETDLRSLHEALPAVRLVLNRTEGASGGGRHLSDPDLAAAGVTLVLHPMTAVLAALRAASVAYHALAVPPAASGAAPAFPGSESPRSDRPGSGVPGSGISGSGIPGSGSPRFHRPESGVPESGVPESGVPESGVPESGVPESGVPESGVPESGVPESGVPESGVAESGVAGSTRPGSGEPKIGPRAAAASDGASAGTGDHVDLMPPAVLATLTQRGPASFLPDYDAPRPAPVPAVPPTPFGAPAFGSREDRPWAAAEPAERPWTTVSQPDEPPASAFDQPHRPGAAPIQRPGVAAAQRLGAAAAGRTWTSIARQVSRLDT